MDICTFSNVLCNCLSISDTLKIKNKLAYHEQLQQQHQQKQQGLLLLLAERILLTPVELEFNGPSLPAANVVGDPNVAPTADMFENDAELVCDGFGTLSLPPISVLLLPLFSCPLSWAPSPSTPPKDLPAPPMLNSAVCSFANRADILLFIMLAFENIVSLRGD